MTWFDLTGFRAETCIAEFEKYKGGGEVNSLIIEDTLNILEGVNVIASRKGSIADCISKYGTDVISKYRTVFGKDSNFLSEQKKNEYNERRAGLEKTVTILTQIKNKQQVDIHNLDYSIGFLKGVSERFLSSD